MSSRARRLAGQTSIRPFEWSGEPPPDTARDDVPQSPARPDATPRRDAHEQRLAALEREAFAKGYEQGERAGLAEGAAHAEALVRRLVQTIEDLAKLRRTMIQQTEHQMVELAIAMAKRIVRREIAIDRDFALAMARVALDRLGHRMEATLRLHPDDYALAVGRKDELCAGSNVSIVPDPAVTRGGCVVESELGIVDGTVEAQFEEVARAVLAGQDQEPALLSHGS